MSVSCFSIVRCSSARALSLSYGVFALPTRHYGRMENMVRRSIELLVDEKLLGPKPVDDPLDFVERKADGELLGCAGWRAHGQDAELKRLIKSDWVQLVPAGSGVSPYEFLAASASLTRPPRADPRSHHPTTRP